MQQCLSIDDQVYLDVYNELAIRAEHISYFNSFETFKLFCEKDFTRLTGLERLVADPQIQLRNKIVKSICQRMLSHQKPVTYFKAVYRR